MATHNKPIDARDKGATAPMKKQMEHRFTVSQKAGNGYKQVVKSKAINKGNRV